MPLYTGIDLHSSNNYITIIDHQSKKVLKKRLKNDTRVILDVLKPYKEDIAGIAVESTYNWYWLVDELMADGYRVHLANPLAMKRYSGLKYSDDNSDALWLADLLRLNILPEGYIYPKETRPLRDLLRKRGHLVKIRTALLLSLQNIISRNRGIKVVSNELKKKTGNCSGQLLFDNEELSLAVTVSKESIDFMAKQIIRVEKAVEKKAKLEKEYQLLLTLPGVGRILGLTIELETGPINRFAKIGDYTSYCRKVTSQWMSNDKIKGKGNKKNGNKYLAWAFSEAAEYARRYNEACRRFYNRKLNQKNRMVAHNALAHKLARAAYYIIRDKVPFDEKKLFV